MSDIFKVWVDNSADPDQGSYLVDNTILGEHNPTMWRLYPNNTKKFALNPRLIQELLYLDKPDVIITHQRSRSDVEQPILAVEFSEQTPMGQNPYQRFPRAVAAAEASVPFVMVFPSKNWVPRAAPARSSWEFASPFIFNGLRKLTDFHGLPALAVDWPMDDENHDPVHGHRRNDHRYRNLPDTRSVEAKELFAIINIVLQNTLDRGTSRDLFRNRTIMAKINSLDERRMGRGADFLDRPPPQSGDYIRTSDLEAYVRDSCSDDKFREDQLPDHLLSRADSFVFSASTRTFRADPYTGTLLVYDYSFCRYGATKNDRHTNMIIHLPEVDSTELIGKYEYFHGHRCPFRSETVDDPRYLALHLRDGCRYTKQKELRVFFGFADVVILNDLVLF